MEFISELQREIIEAKEKNICVLSSAASGKTTVLTERVKYLLENGVAPESIVVFTFTNAAAEEMKKRIGGLGALCFINTVHAYAYYLLVKNGIDTSSAINEEDFDEFFNLIQQHPEVIEPVDYLLLDEAQDSNLLQFQFILKMIKPAHCFIVGDARQCQPEGTKILLRGGQEKNIEEIEIGDDICYYEPEKGRCCGLNGKIYNAIHKKVLEKSSRSFSNDNLITITTGSGKKSSYTPNHRTFIKLNYCENKQVVYLMCDSNYRFRVGQVPLFYTGNKNNGHSVNPWRTKMKNEGCEKIWIVKVCDTVHEATVEEAKISYQYQIPQTCWQIDKTQWTIEDLEYIYKELDTKKTAEKCLKDYGLDIKYPLLDFSIEWSAKGHFTTNSTVEIFAANLIPEYMSCLCYGSETNNSNKHFENIKEVKKEYIKTPIKVYSLKTEAENYIADGIITHNSIYSFNGGRPDILIAIANDPNFTTYELNENYRNGPHILNFARKIIRGNELGDYALYDNSICMNPVRADFVNEIEYLPSRVIEQIKADPRYGKWFVLTRTNSQLDNVVAYLIRAGIPCDTFKRSQITSEEFQEKMTNDTVKVLTVHSAKGLEADNVIVIGVPKWNKKAEERRVAYVAATRAREKLIWMRSAPKKPRLQSWE